MSEELVEDHGKHDSMIDINLLKSRVPFWEDLNDEEEEFFLANTVKLQYEKGQMVNRSIHECRGIMVVEAGSLRVFINSAEGKEINLFRLESGEFCVLSAHCMFESLEYDIFIEAEGPTSIYLTPTSYAKKLMEKNVQVYVKCSDIIIKRFSEVLWTMHQILFMKMDHRLAQFLVDEVEKTGEMTVRMTREEIAQRINSAREVVTKTLHYLEKEGSISLSRGKIEVLNVEQLKDLLQ